jgi:Lysine methyltransferase
MTQWRQRQTTGCDEVDASQHHPAATVPDTITVLELGAGCGLTGLAAALCLRRHFQKEMSLSSPTISTRVILTDFNPTVLENLKSNIALNDLNDICSVVGLDFYQQVSSTVDSDGVTKDKSTWVDMSGLTHEPVDMIVGADIICRPQDAQAIARTLAVALRSPSTGHSNGDSVAYIVCADAAHRFGVECFVDYCERLDLIVHTRDANEIYDRMMQHRNLEQTAGYVEGMNLTLFTIYKSTSR